jgi:hypothetical protein
MRKILLFLVAVSLLVWTNPSQADHQRVFAETFKAENPILGFLGIGNAASVFIAYDSYAVFSVGRVGERMVSVGVLGKVWSKAPPIERDIAESLRGSR